MQNKLVAMLLIWGFVIVAYIILAVFMPAGQELVSQASTDIAASANMSNFPGAQEMVDSSPVWVWVIPGLVGVIFTAITLKRGDKRN